MSHPTGRDTQLALWMERCAPEAPRRPRCLCCGADSDVTTHRLTDGRVYAVCGRCASACEFCQAQLTKEAA